MNNSILFIFALLPFLLPAQQLKKSTGAYQVNLSRSDLSEAEACQTCIELAMIEAIEKQYGRVVLQGNTTVIENIQTGESVETEQVFNMIAETYVNGEWVETLNESCERFVYEDEFWVKCEVKGRVRELTQPKLDLEAKTLACLDFGCETFEYKNGTPLYLYLKSPVDGYITIYLTDTDVAQRLFPYREMPANQLNAVKVKADKEYVLFSQEKDQLNLRGYVDEYEMMATDAITQNRLYVIYSPEPLVKPLLYRDNSQPDYEMPLQLTYLDFQKWLAQQRRYNEGMEVFRLDVSIKP